MSEFDDSPYVDVSECSFTVKDENGKVLLVTRSPEQAFAHKKLIPGSRVFVEAKVDATIEIASHIMRNSNNGDA